MIRRLIISLALIAVLLVSVAPVQAATQTTLFKWTHQGSGSVQHDTSGYGPGWKTVFWCVGGFGDVATLTEFDDITSPPTPLYSIKYHCDGGRHTHLESNSLFYESWQVTERTRDITTLKAIGQCTGEYC